MDHIAFFSRGVVARSRRVRKMVTAAVLCAFWLGLHAAHASEIASQRNVTLSPDGGLIAYVESEQGMAYIWVAHARNPANRKALTIWNSTFVSYTWSADSSRLIFQRRDGNGHYALGVFPVDQKGEPAWYQGGANAALRRYVLTGDGSLAALEVDGAGAHVRTFSSGEAAGRDELTIPAADQALMTPAGALVAYHVAGQWYVGHRGNYREVADMQDAHIISADNQAVYAVKAATGGDVRLMKYNVDDQHETFLTRLPAASTSVTPSDASVRLIRPTSDAPWMAVDSPLEMDVAYANAKGMGEAELIQLSDDGKTWLLTLNPGDFLGNARYAIYYADDKAFALLFGRSGSVLGSVH